MVSTKLIELGEQMTTNYLVAVSSRPPAEIRAALGRIETAEKKSDWSLRLVLDSATASALYFSYGYATEQTWHATVTLYPVGGWTIVVADIDKWTEVLERGTFKSTVHIAEPQKMEQFFGSVSAAVRSVDPAATVTLSSNLPAEVRSQLKTGRTDDPTPTDVKAGMPSSNMCRDVLIQASGSPLWTDTDGYIYGQWALSTYGHRKTVAGVTGFVEDESLFPATRYVLKDLRGMLYATACRLVVYFPFGRNGFMFGTPHADGYVRAGHLRYQWISQISYSDGTNNFAIINMLSNKGRLTFSYFELDGTQHELTVLLDAKPPLAEPVALRIRQLVTQFRLQHAGADASMLQAALMQPFYPMAGHPGVMVWDAPGAISTGTSLNS